MALLPSNTVKNIINLLPKENSDNQVCFKVYDGYRVYIPKDLLIKKSDYFKNLFSSGFSESLNKEHIVEVPQFNSEIIVIVALFLCSGNLYDHPCSPEEFKNLYSLADQWQITSLIKTLLNEVENSIEIQDAGSFLFDFAFMYKPLRDKVVTMIAQDFNNFRNNGTYDELLGRRKELEEWGDLIGEILEKVRSIEKSPRLSLLIKKKGRKKLSLAEFLHQGRE